MQDATTQKDDVKLEPDKLFIQKREYESGRVFETQILTQAEFDAGTWPDGLKQLMAHELVNQVRISAPGIELSATKLRE